MRHDPADPKIRKMLDDLVHKMAASVATDVCEQGVWEGYLLSNGLTNEDIDDAISDRLAAEASKLGWLVEEFAHFLLKPHAESSERFERAKGFVNESRKHSRDGVALPPNFWEVYEQMYVTCFGLSGDEARGVAERTSLAYAEKGTL